MEWFLFAGGLVLFLTWAKKSNFPEVELGKDGDGDPEYQLRGALWQHPKD